MHYTRKLWSLAAFDRWHWRPNETLQEWWMNVTSSPSASRTSLCALNLLEARSACEDGDDKVAFASPPSGGTDEAGSNTAVAGSGGPYSGSSLTLVYGLHRCFLAWRRHWLGAGGGGEACVDVDLCGQCRATVWPTRPRGACGGEAQRQLMLRQWLYVYVRQQICGALGWLPWVARKWA
nr:unnamed protein product [Digitaria exilis]